MNAISTHLLTAKQKDVHEDFAPPVRAFPERTRIAHNDHINDGALIHNNTEEEKAETMETNRIEKRTRKRTKKRT